ncbi:MAG: hypothetical protein AAF220_01275 [Pseudomonadota bacterium]
MSNRLSYFLGLDRGTAHVWSANEGERVAGDADMILTETLRQTSLPRLTRAMAKLDRNAPPFQESDLPTTVGELLHAGAPAEAETKFETLEYTLFSHPQQPRLCSGIHVRDRLRVDGWPELRASFAASEIGFGMSLNIFSSAIPAGERLALIAWRWGNEDVRERSIERLAQIASNQTNGEWLIHALTAASKMFQDFPHPVTDAVNSLRMTIWEAAKEKAA